MISPSPTFLQVSNLALGVVLPTNAYHAEVVYVTGENAPTSTITLDIPPFKGREKAVVDNYHEDDEGDEKESENEKGNKEGSCGKKVPRKVEMKW